MFTGDESHQIPLGEAAEFTARFRSSHSKDDGIGLFYSKKFLTSVLQEPECVGIRVYFGENADGEPQPVIVGVDKDGNDLTEGIIGELGLPCPPYCSEDNPLNTSE
ncbi:MAG: hypothetical protein MAGBODY4_00408 [Candidatus Marinimicrobia bacterium]|nr:hypothetical protein [Candidatus Neomarinimicrobiota bacterium]